MVQFRRLDPLANAGPWQRAMKRGVKTFTLTQEQFDRVAERRPQIIVSGEDSVVMGRPYRDFLQVHYAYAEVPAFRDSFKPMLKEVLAQSSREEAPRGVLLSFRDRPNRPMANRCATRPWRTAHPTAGPRRRRPASAGPAALARRGRRPRPHS